MASKAAGVGGRSGKDLGAGMARNRKKRQHPCRAVKNAVYAAVASSGPPMFAYSLSNRQVMLVPVDGTTIRRMKATADDRANDGCEGKVAKND